MIDFVTRERNNANTDKEVSLSLTGSGTKKKPYRLNIAINDNGMLKMGNPEYITAAIVKEKDHIRCYFKSTTSAEGFHGDKRSYKTRFCVPRLDKGKMQEMVGEYDLKYSKTYKYWYVEKEIIDFVGRR